MEVLGGHGEFQGNKKILDFRRSEEGGVWAVPGKARIFFFPDVWEGMGSCRKARIFLVSGGLGEYGQFPESKHILVFWSSEEVWTVPGLPFDSIPNSVGFRGPTRFPFCSYPCPVGPQEVGKSKPIST